MVVSVAAESERGPLLAEIEKRISTLMVINEHFLNTCSFWREPQRSLKLAWKEAFEDYHPAYSLTPSSTPMTPILASHGENSTGGPVAAPRGGRVLGADNPGF